MEAKRSAAAQPVQVLCTPNQVENLLAENDALRAALRDILEGVGAFNPDGWLAKTEEIVRARKLLETDKA